MNKVKRVLQRIKVWWEGILLSLREAAAKKYGLIPYILLGIVCVAALCLIVYLLARFWVIFVLIIGVVVYWISEHPAPPAPAEDELGWRIAEVVAATAQKYEKTFGLDRPALVNEVFPNGRSPKDDQNGFTQFHFILFSLRDELDCDVLRDLLQREINRAFYGSSHVIVVTTVQPSLWESRGYDITVALNPPQGWNTPPRPGGSEGNDLFDEDF